MFIVFRTLLSFASQLSIGSSLCGISFLIAVATPAPAALIVIPPGFENGGGQDGDSTPLGAAGIAQRFQQVFGAALLGGLQVGDVITGLTFRLTEASFFDLPPQTVTNYEIRLSRSVHQPASLDLVFANNRGADEVIVRSGPLVFNEGDFRGGSSPNPFGVIIPFTNPYTYAGGPLLIEIGHTGFPSGGRFVDVDYPTALDATAIFADGFSATQAPASRSYPEAIIIQLQVSRSTTSPPNISLVYDGNTRDRVGQGEFARNPDGSLDGVFTVTLNTGSGNRTVTRLDLVRNNGDGIWNTNPGDGFWTLGAATNETAPLYNAANDSVNFFVSEGGTFKIFAADLQNRLFTPGSAFVLTASFADGTTATASVTIPSANVAPILAYNGSLRDRVRQENNSQAADGHLDPTFTVNFSAGGSTRTVASLQLTSSNGGVWDTNSTTGFWTLGAATNFDAPLYNASNDGVSFAVSPGGSFVVFASDWFLGAPFPNGLFQPGNQFTLTIGFSDGGTAMATTTIAGNNEAITLSYNGPLQDRVADDNHAVRADGVLDQTFTVSFSAGGVTRTVTSLRLDSSDGGVWDTSAATGFWSLAAATNLQSPSYNTVDDSVNFAVPAGGTFMIFASDWFRGAPFPNGLFQKGKAFTLTIGFNDGSTAQVNTTIP